MKAIVISDIHGDLDVLNSIIDKIYKYNIDKLIILGDYCSYYNDSIDIAQRLNNFKSIIECVRGNSDTAYFLKNFNLETPTLKNINFNNITVTLTHGHLYNENLLPTNCGKILFQGHTHKKFIHKHNNLIVANPGSIAKPRDGVASYIYIDEKKLYIKDMNDNIIEFIKY